MDALVKDALDRVNKTLDNINWEYPKDTDIAKAIYAVDALKSSLKTVTPQGPQTLPGALADTDEESQNRHLRDQIEHIK